MLIRREGGDKTLLFLAIPKTGTTSIERACLRARLWVTYSGVNKHSARLDGEHDLVATALRHPLEWLPSVYRYMTEFGWGPMPGPACILGRLDGRTFEAFVSDMLEREPRACTRIFNDYLELADVVGQSYALMPFFGRRSRIGSRSHSAAAAGTAPHRRRPTAISGSSARNCSSTASRA